jgi:hypothetical protein
MEIICPLCDSKKTQRLALTYAKGVSTTSSTSVGVGASSGLLAVLGLVFLPFTIALGALGFARIGVFGFKTRGQTKTGLAAETEPPKKMSWVNVVLMATAYTIAIIVAALWTGKYAIPLAAHAFLIPTKTLDDTSFTNAPFAIQAFIVVFGGIWLAILLGGLALGFRGAWHFNTKTWARREAGWQRTFLCKRCGGNFLAPDYDPIGVNVVRSDRLGTGEYLPRAETPEQRAAVSAKAASDDVDLRKKGQQRRKRYD